MSSTFTQTIPQKAAEQASKFRDQVTIQLKNRSDTAYQKLEAKEHKNSFFNLAKRYNNTLAAGTTGSRSVWKTAVLGSAIGLFAGAGLGAAFGALRGALISAALGGFDGGAATGYCAIDGAIFGASAGALAGAAFGTAYAFRHNKQAFENNLTSELANVRTMFTESDPNTGKAIDDLIVAKANRGGTFKKLLGFKFVQAWHKFRDTEFQNVVRRINNDDDVCRNIANHIAIIEASKKEAQAGKMD